MCLPSQPTVSEEQTSRKLRDLEVFPPIYVRFASVGLEPGKLFPVLCTFFPQLEFPRYIFDASATCCRRTLSSYVILLNVLSGEFGSAPEAARSFD